MKRWKYCSLYNRAMKRFAWNETDEEMVIITTCRTRQVMKQLREALRYDLFRILRLG